MRIVHREEKGLTLIELLIVIAIVGIIAAVIIPNIGTFMTMGTVSAANSEAENVKTAATAYYADVQAWPNSTLDEKFGDYIAGRLKAEYYFDSHGFLYAVSSPGTDVPDTESSEYDGIVWEYPIQGVATEGDGQWVRVETP